MRLNPRTTAEEGEETVEVAAGVAPGNYDLDRMYLPPTPPLGRTRRLTLVEFEAVMNPPAERAAWLQTVI